MKAMLGVIAITILSVACSEAQLPTSPTAAAPFVGDGSASVSTMSIRDLAPLPNSCGIEGFRVHQSQGPHNTIKTTFERRPTVGPVRWSIWLYRRLNVRGATADTFPSVPTKVISASDLIWEVEEKDIPSGIYMARGVIHLCTQLSAPDFFTIPGAPADSEPVILPLCNTAIDEDGCTAWPREEE